MLSQQSHNQIRPTYSVIQNSGLQQGIRQGMQQGMQQGYNQGIHGFSQGGNNFGNDDVFNNSHHSGKRIKNTGFSIF